MQDSAPQEYEREQFWEKFASAARQTEADPVAAAAEAEERQVWDRAVRDGLDRD